ncbi:MAG: condensation domain-containing protein, partial [Acidobacteriota bacterium]
VPLALEIRGDLDVDALGRSLGEVVRRHGVLRSRFEERDGGPVQVMLPPSEIPLEVEDLGAGAAALEAWLASEAATPFDLETGPVLRARLAQPESERHVLVLHLHHIACDGWSLEVLVQELGAVYGAILRGEPSPLPDLPVQFGDFAAWEAEQLDGGSMEEPLAWWRDRLAGLEASTEIPADRPRPRMQTYRGSVAQHRVSRGLSEGLRELARARGETPFVVLLAGFKALVSRYSGRVDVAVGAPSSGRRRTELEGLVGFFIDTLVLRTDLSSDPTFGEIAARTAETVLEAQAHGDLPFERLVEALQPERDTSRQPFFQLFFQVLDMDWAPDLPGLRCRRLPLDVGTAKFDLDVTVFDRTDGMRIEAEYATDLFDPATVERFLGAYETLLTAAVEDPTRRLSELPVIPPADRHLLEETWNATAEDYPRNERLGDLLDRQAAVTPDAVALVTADPSVLWTYRRLSEGSHRLARELREGHGVGPGVLVALCLDRSADLVVAMLAVVHSGGAYVPLDPSYPEERLRFTLEDADARLLLTQEGLLEALPEDRPPVLTVDRFLADAAGTEEPVGRAPAPGCAEDLAYVIYTSGSTGRPKGVAITHRNAVAMVNWSSGAFTDDELAGVLFSTSVCFDLSVFEVFATLTCGGAVILAENLLELPRLGASAESAPVPVTLVNTVPSALRELLREGHLPATVRTVNLAGEALPLDLVERAYAEPSVERVYNLYGPSEDTTYSTY